MLCSQMILLTLLLDPKLVWKGLIVVWSLVFQANTLTLRLQYQSLRVTEGWIIDSKQSSSRRSNWKINSTALVHKVGGTLFMNDAPSTIIIQWQKSASHLEIRPWVQKWGYPYLKIEDDYSVGWWLKYSFGICFRLNQANIGLEPGSPISQPWPLHYWLLLVG